MRALNLQAQPYSWREVDHGYVPLIESVSFRANQGPLVEWNDPSLASFVRVRMTEAIGMDGEEPYVGVLYAHGLLRQGGYCRVNIPAGLVPRNRCREALTIVARRFGVDPIALGLFRALSTAR